MEFLTAATLLAVVTTTVASNCTVCYRGRCLATSSFYGGQDKLSTGRMAIDYNSNILYHYDNGIHAIHLDNNTMTPVPTLGNKGNYLAVDQDTGALYYYQLTKERNPIYRYHPKTGNSDAFVIGSPKFLLPPFHFWIHNSTIYFNTRNESGYDVCNGLYSFSNSVCEKVAALDNIIPNNIVFDKVGNMYIKSGAEIYRLKVNAKEPVLFASARYLLAGDRTGEVYLFDATKRYMYQVNTFTDQLSNMGAYDASRDGRKRPNVREFMFDKNNNLILKDKWSTLYFKDFPAKCEWSYNKDYSRTKISQLRDDL